MTFVNISPEIISLIEQIKNDKVHGASQLARQAVNVLKLAAEHSQADSAEQFWGELAEVGERLKAVRPAMAPIFNIASRFLDALPRVSPDESLDIVKSLAIFQAAELISDSLQAIAQIVNYGSELIGDGDRIITHSYRKPLTGIGILK